MGLTTTGKTDLALKFARKLNGELISCDSRQVFTGLDLGTGKLPSQEKTVKIEKFPGHWRIDGVLVHMYDVADPRQRYTVKNYTDQAEEVISNIIKNRKLPIIVGGTGLYLKALLEGLPNLAIPDDLSKRGDLAKLNLKDLQEQLIKLSPQKWQSLNMSDRQNPRRLLRSIELLNMNPYSNTRIKQLGLESKFNVLKIGLTAPRPIINNRINLRLSARIQQGLMEEARKLYSQGLSLDRMKELGLEYGCLADLLAKQIDKHQFELDLQNKIHQFAKRQWTWFKKVKKVYWFDITATDWTTQVDNLTHSWYYSGKEGALG